MMMSIIPFLILSITFTIPGTTAFSSRSSNSIASRRSMTSTPTPTTIITTTTTELSYTPFDTADDISIFSLHNNNGGCASVLGLELMEKTAIANIIVGTETTTTSTTATTTTSVSPMNVVQQQQTNTNTNNDNDNDNNNKELNRRYAIVLGRLMILCISFLPLVRPHQIMFEFFIQLFLLSLLSMQPIKRSVTLVQCIASSETNGVEECQIQFEDLEEAFDINNKGK